MQERMSQSDRADTLEERKRLELHEREMLRARKAMLERERQLEQIREKLSEEQLEKERKLHQEMAAREALFAEREHALMARQREFEMQLARRQSEIEMLRKHLTEEVSSREAKLQEAVAALEQEKERYNIEGRKRIEATSKTYVSKALTLLEVKEAAFHKMSKLWAGVGALSLIVGLVFFAYMWWSGVSAIPDPLSWEFIILSLTKGVVAVALLGALARYAFLFSTSYMREALKNADRRHAINFGEFYLESYGAAADWSQVKDAFANWNTMGSNAFSAAPIPSFKLTDLEQAAAVIEKVRDSLVKTPRAEV